MIFFNRNIKKRKIHQIIHFTRFDRYPEIFKKCSRIKKGKIKILSFGCSDGTECHTLRTYFPEAEIVGIEINKKMLNRAIKENNDKNIKFYGEIGEFYGKFDLIFCMSVLCRHPETYSLFDCSSQYSFEDFEFFLKTVIDRLKINGGIVIYNSNFIFSDSKYSENFVALPSCDQHGSGFVIKFDKYNKRLTDQQSYKFCIFFKIPLYL